MSNNCPDCGYPNGKLATHVCKFAASTITLLPNMRYDLDIVTDELTGDSWVRKTKKGPVEVPCVDAQDMELVMRMQPIQAEALRLSEEEPD